MHKKKTITLENMSKIAIVILRELQYNSKHKRREEVITNMTEKFMVGDLDDLIYGNSTVMPSDR